MESAGIIFRQTVIMFIYMAAGWGLYRKGLVTKEGSRSLANILLYVILPCVIIKSFCVEADAGRMKMVLISFAGAAAVLAAAMFISHLLFGKRPMDDFGAAFSNAGFMGLPLISAALGPEAVVYAAAMIAFLNILQWTYGQKLIGGNKAGTGWKMLILNPLLAALILGCAVFFLKVRLPALILDCMGTVSGMNAPAAMIILGIYLGDVRIREIFLSKQVWICSAVRLILIPLVTLGILYILFPGQREMALSLLIAASAPVGANLAVYAQKLGKDYGYAVKLICHSTIVSVITMPVIILLWNMAVG